jgi:hypothetical protein
VSREIDGPLEIDDDLLCGLFSDTRDTREDSIIFELDRLEESLTPESEEAQCGLPTDSIDLEKLTKKHFLLLIEKSKKRLSRFIYMVIEPDFCLLSYANIRDKCRRYEDIEPESRTIHETGNIDPFEGEDFASNIRKHTLDDE